MDRYWLRDILSIVLFCCDLVLTQEIIYRTVGSTVELVCPIVSSRDITWLGPPNYQHYAVGTEIFPEVSNQVAVSETDADKKSILLIHRFSKDNSGDYKCTDGFDKKEFNLINKRNPSNLVISNKTDDKTNTVEGKEHNLECRVTSGQPGGNITWSTDGVVVARNEPSFVSHRLTPKRSDNGKIFKCEAFNSDDEKILESSVRIEVFYIPKITFSPSKTVTVKEGEEAHLICQNDVNDPNTTTYWKTERTETIISNNDTLKFKRVNRTDAGLYICMVQTKAGVYKDNANIAVQYAPTIDIQYVPTERKMECIPSGVPDRYEYKDWEHTTEYNDHIRFLPITKEGNNAILTIPKHETGKDHQRDRGLYICRASNNISSSDGMFVVKKYNLNFKGTLYFVSSSKNTQYGVYLKTAKIEIKFVSVPEYSSYDVFKNESRFTGYNESVHRNIQLTDTIYGTNVSVKGSMISLQIPIDTLDDFNVYKVVVKNAEGSSHHTINLVSASAPFMPTSLQALSQQTVIYVLWKPGFDGGYRQWFIVEYQEIGDMYWDNETTNSSNSLLIGGLQPATKYLIRMFARNMIDDSNRTEEILVKTNKRVSETKLSTIVSLFAVFLCLLITATYFRRGKLKQFIYTRFTNQANARAFGNDLNELHTHRDSAAEIPVYSSIDKRHNLRLHQTGAYTVEQKCITNPLKSVHQKKETGKHVNRVSQFESMKCSSEIEQKEKESRELNYVEIIFDQKPVYPFTIHGLDDKTNYVEIDFTQSADPLPDSDTESESDK